MRYVAESPLRSLARQYLHKADEQGTLGPIEEPQRKTRKLKRVGEDFGQIKAGVEETMQAMDADNEESDDGGRGR